MPDTTNDIVINALLDYLRRMDMSNMHAALTALVAERNALLGRVAAQDQDIKALSAANAILRGKLTESPHAASDLRERLVCAIWPVLIQQWREYKDAIDPRGCARSDALEEADKMLAAMRKGEA